MLLKNCLFLINLYIILLQFIVIDGACVCNAKGVDHCEQCTKQEIIRPKNRYPDQSDIDLPPIGDNCWCSKLLIEPASLPKPCKKTPPKSSCGCKKAPLCPHSSSNYGNYLKISKPRDDSPVADPISISIAAQAGTAFSVPEAKLSYGFNQKPIDGLKKVYFSSVPEENLFKLKSDVITLKKKSQKYPKEEEEDVYEEEEEVESDDDDDELPQLTYKQLGYVTEQFKNPKFREVSVKYEQTDNYPIKRCNKKCDFRPGRIAPYRKDDIESDMHSCY